MIKLTEIICIIFIIMCTAYLESSCHEKCLEKPFFVGELGAQWEFPSDHLPVGLSVNDHHFVSWNVLNTQYIYMIEATNDQGIRDGLISKTNIPLHEDTDLTFREQIIIDQILAMIHHPVYPRSVIALQEVGKCFFDSLKMRLPHTFKWTAPFPDESILNTDIVLYDHSLFDLVSSKVERYACKSKNTLMSVTFQDKSTKKLIRLVHSHVPGDPLKLQTARKELVEFSIAQYDPNIPLVIFGDMNQPAENFMKVFEKIFTERQILQPFIHLKVPYPTHINTKQETAWIDNMIVALPETTKALVSELGEDFFPEVAHIIDLFYILAPEDAKAF